MVVKPQEGSGLGIGLHQVPLAVECSIVIVEGLGSPRATAAFGDWDAQCWSCKARGKGKCEDSAM